MKNQNNLNPLQGKKFSGVYEGTSSIPAQLIAAGFVEEINPLFVKFRDVEIVGGKKEKMYSIQSRICKFGQKWVFENGKFKITDFNYDFKVKETPLKKNFELQVIEK